jgi:DNA modification methylase
MFDIRHGDCREVLKQLPDCSVDAIVTDPPYELGFMGKAWDSTGVAYQVEVWQECLRVLKVGGHLLAFGGSRTYHRLACAIEDAGFQIRDQIMWVYGSGFPKSLNVSKSIEGLLTTGSANKTAFKHLAGEQVDRGNWGIAKQQFTHGQRDKNYDETASATVLGKLEPTTAEAKEWEGWGTALKPAHEPIVMARKPLEGTVAQTVLTHGTGGINIDGCRVSPQSDKDLKEIRSERPSKTSNANDYSLNHGGLEGFDRSNRQEINGRFPANFIHDGSDEVLELFPQSNGGAFPKKSNVPTGKHYEGGWGAVDNGSRTEMGDGSAARFFYCAKASKKDRNEGLDEFPMIKGGSMNGVETRPNKPTNHPIRANHHPTVKPTDLMRYLCRLVTPPNGTVLDPFTGSGSTGKAATLEDFNFIGIEQSAEYVEIATARINHAEQQC